MGAKLVREVLKTANLFPEFERKLDTLSRQYETELAEIYGRGYSPLRQAILKTKLPVPDKDASLKEKMEFAIARYAAYEDAIANPQYKITKEEVVETAAKLIKASAPLAISMALTVGPEVLISAALGGTLSLGAILATSAASFAASESASAATKKAIENRDFSEKQKKWIDLAVRVASGVAAGTATNAIAKKLLSPSGLSELKEVSKIPNKVKVAVGKDLTKRAAQIAEEVSQLSPNPEVRRISKLGKTIKQQAQKEIVKAKTLDDVSSGLQKAIQSILSNPEIGGTLSADEIGLLKSLAQDEAILEAFLEGKPFPFHRIGGLSPDKTKNLNDTLLSKVNPTAIRETIKASLETLQIQ
jgi:hypothetical protein